jgi:hypothetical protein
MKRRYYCGIGTSTSTGSDVLIDVAKNLTTGRLLERLLHLKYKDPSYSSTQTKVSNDYSTFFRSFPRRFYKTTDKTND